jgi:outer membrane protein assembly factor BamA
MSLRILTVLAALLFAYAFCITAWSEDRQASSLCPTWIVIGKLDPGLTDGEKRLVCGDPEKKPKVPNEAWREIPFPQARYNFRNFLQERGYHHPRFRYTDSSMNRSIVELGEKTRVKGAVLEGDEGWVDLSRRRKIVGQPLTPSLLDTLEKWVYEQMRAKGFGCPVVTSLADPDTGEIVVHVTPGQRQTITFVSQDAIPGTHPNILRRYDAFGLGDVFNGDLLTVTENRISSLRLVESTHFTTSCHPDGVHAHQVVVPGFPHVLTAGAGINTEGALLGKVSWRDTRLGYSGSLLDISAYASSKLQSLQSQLQWYYLPYVSRLFLFPLVQFAHRNEVHFEVITLRSQFGFATTQEHQKWGASYFLGPTLDFYRTLRGVGAPSSRLFSLEGRVDIKSHYYEYYAAEPQSGYRLSFIGDLNYKGYFSDFTAQRLSASGEALWNVGGFSPPLWIVGFRALLGTVLTQEALGPNTIIPPSIQRYLGGSMDIRGFGRQELPTGTEVGGLTSAYFGVELRLSHTLPVRVDPFVFFDVGALGSTSFDLEAPVYWSPGIGIRWVSPIGALRTTFAHGYSGTNPQHWQFFLSLGEEF